MRDELRALLALPCICSLSEYSLCVMSLPTAYGEIVEEWVNQQCPVRDTKKLGVTT